ncbi:MAG TPA: hypothetical protein VMH04_02385 [Candidatus Solibacter sp.]|nr:hypothetical protein [Candidatus Solibacter sp.]
MNRFVTSLFAVVFLLAAAAQSQLQPQFFGMGVSTPGDMPKVSFGTISHPPVAWTMIEGTGRGKFNFKPIDGFVIKAPKNAQGAALVTIDLGGWTPEWAVTDHTTCYHNASGVGVCTIPPDNMQDWIDFVTAVIQHYNGVTAPHVAYYEIWNEASNTKFWTGTVAQMLAMAQTAYPILKQDKLSMVLTPSVVWMNGVKFMTAYLAAGGGAFADGLTFHGYPSQTGPGTLKPVPMPESPLSTNAPIMTMISTFRQLADSNGMQGKPIMTTEGGWGTNGVSDPDQQTAWITHYEILQAGLSASNNLAFQDWFTWGQAFSGTIENSSGQPTPAGLAYNVVYGWLVNQMPQPCASSDSIIWSCVVGSNLIVWNAAQTCNNGVCTTAPYTAPFGYSKYVDVTNATTTINGSIKLGLKPIMLKP